MQTGFLVMLVPLGICFIGLWRASRLKPHDKATLPAEWHNPAWAGKVHYDVKSKH